MAATPASVQKLVAQKFVVRVERGAGVAAGFDDAGYEGAGAELVDVDTVWSDVDVVVKVRAPDLDESSRLREGTVVICTLQADRHPERVEALAARKVTVVALEKIPRVTRAQKMDVLSSMANLAGYRAVIEATQHFQGFFGPQVTAAGSTPPAKVLIIGAGVAGLAAVAAARALGAEVRAFDTRAATREQVESLGATFLEVDLKESGEGQGGYAKEMSQAFLDAEMALFRAQAREVDVIVTTALVPGRKAPVLVPDDVIECLRPGSVIVDMAAEQGGNCSRCVPDEIAKYKGVTIVGHTDLTSRMANTASLFFANNVVHLLGEMGGGEGFKVDLENDVVRPAVVLHLGEKLAPPPPKEPAPAKPAQAPSRKPPPDDAKPRQTAIQSPTRRAWSSTLGGLALITALFALGRFAPGDFLQHFTVFILACFVGWQVIWSVTPALHTPLMSVTNAISGIIIVGGILQVRSPLGLGAILGALAVLFAAINVAGGFLVTERMLKMFRRDDAKGGGA